MAAVAKLRGFSILWGRCYEGEGAPPYWPWIHALREHIQSHDSETLRSQMGSGVTNIAEIVPDAAFALETPQQSPLPISPEFARFRLFDSIASFIKNASQSKPLVIILDNLHWADKTSLLLLEFLAPEIARYRILILGTYRDMELSRRHPLSQSLGELATLPHFQRVLLRGLSEPEVANLIQQTAAIKPPDALVQQVYAQTEGNPFFVTQVAALLEQEGTLIPSTSTEEGPDEGEKTLLNHTVSFHKPIPTIRIPEGVREAIGRRLSRLSDFCNEALTIASVIGQEFDYRLLERLMGQKTATELINALDEALAAGVLEEPPSAGGRFQFTHSLIRRTLYSELLTSRRVRLHARIAEAMEEVYGSQTEGRAAELTHHLSQAETVMGTEKLVKYSLLAGEQALSKYAYEEALEHFQRGLAARAEGPEDMETAAILSGLGRVQLATLDPHEYQEALINLGRAFAYYAKIGDVSHAVAVARSPVQSSLLTGRHTGVIELVGQALALVPPDSHEAGQLLCQYGNSLYYETGDYHGTLKALNQAISIAQQREDAALEMRALVAAGHAEAAHLHFQESLRFDLRALALASTADEPFEETHALQEVAAVLHRTGDLEGARRYAAAMLPVAERLRHRTRLWQALHANTVVSSLEGDWVTAISLSDRALALSPRNPNLLGYRALMAYTVGDFVQDGTYLEQLLEAMQQTAPGPTFEYAYPAIVVPLVAHLRDLDSRLEVVEEAAYAVLSSPWVMPVLDSLTRAGLVLLAVRRKDKVAAEEQYSALHPRRGTMLGGLLDSIMSADRLLGLLAHTMGQPDIAATHFEDALVFCRKAGYRPELAWSCYDYAATLVRAGLKPTSTDVHLKAVSLMDETLVISTELGMKPLLEKTSALREGIGPQPVVVSKYPANLTQRQVQVLRLIASGKTDREIERELFISVRTVQRHVADIYVKIGARNRSEATAFALSKLHSFEETS